MRLTQTSAAVAALAVVSAASTPASHVNAVQPLSLLQRRQDFPEGWKPDTDAWGPAPETPNEIPVPASPETKAPVTSVSSC